MHSMAITTFDSLQLLQQTHTGPIDYAIRNSVAVIKSFVGCVRDAVGIQQRNVTFP